MSVQRRGSVPLLDEGEGKAGRRSPRVTYSPVKGGPVAAGGDSDGLRSRDGRQSPPRGHVRRVGHQRDAAPPSRLAILATAISSAWCPCPRRPGHISGQDAMPGEYVRPGTGLGKRSQAASADRHDARGHGLVVEHLRMIESCGEHRRWLAVVLALRRGPRSRRSHAGRPHSPLRHPPPHRTGSRTTATTASNMSSDEKPTKRDFLDVDCSRARAHSSAGHGGSGHRPKSDDMSDKRPQDCVRVGSAVDKITRR